MSCSFQLKSVGPKTVPFFKTVAIFFVLYPTDDANYNPVIFSIFKILPIASLIVFVLLHGMNFSEAYSYSWKILIGLVFSALGDIFLVLKDYGFFIHGIAAFAMAQFLYAWAFDVWPLKLYVGAICAVIASTIYVFLLPGLEGVMVYVGAVYCALIFTMMWRAIARVQFFNDRWVFTQDLWKWTKLCSCIGAFFFVVSDFTIAFDKFVQPVPYAHAIIMFTYYAAQFHITVSVVDSQVDEVLRITREEEEGTISGNLIRKIQKEAREASHRLENSDTLKNIKNGINSIENSERVQKIKQGIVEAQHRIEASEPVQIIKHGITRIETSEPVQIIKQGITRIETSEPVQIIKQGINRLETSEPVLRLRQRLTSRCEAESNDTKSETETPEESTTSAEPEPESEPEHTEEEQEPKYQSTLLTPRPISISS